MKCKCCGQKLVSSDYGWYCDNPNCEQYDEIILSYEMGNIVYRGE